MLGHDLGAKIGGIFVRQFFQCVAHERGAGNRAHADRVDPHAARAK